MPCAYLIIVGEGSRQDALDPIARELRIERHVVFTGRRDDIPEMTAALDVAVLPSYRRPRASRSSRRWHCPARSSRPTGGIPEMVADDDTGFLVPPHDPAALAGAIARLLTDHPFADTMAAPATTSCTIASASSSHGGTAVQTLYDEGARAVRPREILIAG